jgi:peptidoglycan/xylan/chitin deacetylase (PgdA/CDA1 family)
MLQLIPNKREFLAKALTATGLVQLLERAAQRPGILVLTYHRIGIPAESPFYEGVYSASASTLRRQLEQLREQFQILSLADLLAVADSGFVVDRPMALVTFDDGYRDNLEVALPILRELNVPAVFFLPTLFVDQGTVPWWDHTAYVLKQTRLRRIELDWPEPMSLELGGSNGPSAVARVIQLYLDGRIGDEAKFRRMLEDQTQVRIDDKISRSLFITWEEASQIRAAGIAIGSHAQSHRSLGRLTSEEQREELTQSRQILESRLTCEVRALAYPFGWPGSYNETTQQLAQDAGYQLAFVSDAGINRPKAVNRMALRRLNIGFRDSPPLLRARTALQGAFGRSFL